MTRIAFLLLNYNVAKETIKLAKSLASLIDENDRIIIIDNKSTDDSVEFMQPIARALHFDLILSPKNGGYASGNNLGISRAKKLGAEYVFIMNPDIKLNGPLIEPIYNFMISHKSCAIASPSLANSKGTKKYGKRISFGKIHFEDEILVRGFRPQEVQTVDGACYIVRMSAINKVGKLPELYFLNFEETEWCLMFQRAKFKIFSLPMLQVFHEEGSAIRKTSGMQVYFLRRNLVLFNSRMGSKGDLLKLILKLIPFSVCQSIKHLSLDPIHAYVDGITGKNRFDG
ncbi:glycosyltransferase [Secundilactobacillus yichangensis]|uniref:glycosyltransferase n=1 Tax=Secundilactobacillus yichangensis TaxID=2799580 RepID=UPI0019441940|nr:glycosyltransferase family 2 protein [Secundilactobacillus yichangensis]